MNVFAEYLTENDLNYRKRTLLQFGDSWELIGSAVLKNPGSACPIGRLSEQEVDQVKHFIRTGDFISDHWYSFQSDQTMRVLAKIFNGGFTGNSIQLNGVIQLYNLIDLQEPDILLIRSKISNNPSNHLFPVVVDIIKSFQDRPVYFGWFDLWKIVPETEMLAKALFHHIENSPYRYFDSDFESSKFYHPLYVNRSYISEIGLNLG